jgi:pterin-4a-carbinolamine dehydratase
MIKVHQYIDGPYDHGDEWTLLCQIEDKGLVFEEEVSFKDFNSAYNFMNKIKASTQPILYDTESFLWVH